MESRKRNLIRGVIGYLITCSSFEGFEAIVQTLFVLITAEVVDDTVLRSKERLFSLVESHTIQSDLEAAEFDAPEHPNIDSVEIKSQKDTLGYKWKMHFISNINLCHSCYIR